MWYDRQKRYNTVSVTNEKKIYSKSIKNIDKKECRNMISNERYVTFLKRIIACISYGDYYAVKELSQLELEKMEQEIKHRKNSN